MRIALLLLFSHERSFSDLLESDIKGNVWNEIFYEKQDVEDRYAKELTDEGHDCTLYFLSYKRERKEGIHKFGHRVVRLPIDFAVKGIFGYEFSSSLLNELSKQQYDVIFIVSSYYTHFVPFFFMDTYDLTAFFCSKKRWRIISNYAGGSYKYIPCKYLAPARWWVKKKALTLSDKIVTESKVEAKTLMDVFGINERRIAFLRNPVNLELFHKIPKEACAEYLGKDADKKYVLFVGHICERKGISDLISAFGFMVKKYPDMQLLVVGYGADKSNVVQTVKRMNIDNSVSFEGFVPNEKLKFFYSLADMFVLPSYDEGMPNVVLEALACETPTIATTVGDIPSLPNGLLLKVPRGNRTRLLEAMQKIINGEFKINESQRSSLLEECSIKNHQVNLKKIIEETLQHRV